MPAFFNCADVSLTVFSVTVGAASSTVTSGDEQELRSAVQERTIAVRAIDGRLVGRMVRGWLLFIESFEFDADAAQSKQGVEVLKREVDGLPIEQRPFQPVDLPVGEGFRGSHA